MSYFAKNLIRMKPAHLLCLSIAFVGIFTLSAQENYQSALTVPDSLKQNANAVIRLNHTAITLSSQRNMHVKKHRIVTVLNKLGNNAVDAYAHYDASTKIKNMEAVVYDASGKEIKKIKRKHFTDRSIADGVSLFRDDRVLFLDYTPVTYPYTISFSYELETSNTAFIPRWRPVEGYYKSVEKNSFELRYTPELNLRFKEKNFNGFSIKDESSENTLKYTIFGIKAFDYEYGSPSLSSIMPGLMVASEHFHLEGVDGTAKNWKEFGKWIHDYLLKGTDELPEETKTKIKALVSDKETMIEKARAIYTFVQENTRYISVQIGIGGWKPMPAGDVDKLGYGDCKALTNYTKSLLDVAGIASYYTLVYGDRDKINIDSEFTSMQGNHAILGIPDNDDIIWLECTSQTTPFGFQANFTDDRDVLIVTPDGGKIKTTKSYINEDNYQHTKASYTILEDGSMEAAIAIQTQGGQYDYRYRKEKLSEEDKVKSYKEYWDYINNITIDKITHSNDKTQVIFKENVTLKAKNYASISGNRILFTVNAFNNMVAVPDRYRNRTMPLEIDRGYLDEDDYTLKLPIGYTIEASPESTALHSKFGSYEISFQPNEDGTLTYKRKLLIKKGLYPKEEYKNYRSFIKKIVRFDNAKIVLIKNKT